jgi:hypothetical protein
MAKTRAPIAFAATVTAEQADAARTLSEERYADRPARGRWAKVQ